MEPEGFNLEDEYGDLLDLIQENISEMDTVTHFGVKGMKWGVRKSDEGGGGGSAGKREPLQSLGPDSVSRKTASGETVTLKKVPPSAVHKFLGKISPSYREGYKDQANLDILDGAGKKVGNASVQKRNKDELYLEWLGINSSARGKGYATAVMKAGRDFGKQQGFKRMVLEVPGGSPDAHHIYTKLGFKETGKVSEEDDFWGGLTTMVYDFDAKHSDEDNSLTHYGVKGMKWGTRKVHSSYTERRQNADKRDYGSGGVRRINKRMNKGQNYRTARKKEQYYRAKRALVLAGAAYSTAMIAHYGPLAQGSVAQRAETKRGQAAAAAAMGLPRQGSTVNYSKKKNGAYKVTSF